MKKQKNIPQLRFPKFKDSWVNEKMGDIYSFKVTNSFSRENLNYLDGTVKNIHYGDIHTKFQTLFDIKKETLPFVNPNISIERISKDNYCKEGDLILADASEDLNDVGKSIEIVNLNNNKVLSGLHTILARPTFNRLSTGFGGYLFKSKKVRTQIQKESQGSKVISISSTRLSNLSLIIPSKKEQKQIASFFIVIDKKISHFKQKKTLLEQYKKGVMQKLFTQELRFKDDNGKAFPEWVKWKLGELTYKVGAKNKDNVRYPIYSINNKEGFLPQSDQFEGMDSNTRGYDISLYRIIGKNTFAYNPARINVGSIGYSGNLSNIIISSLYVCFKTVAHVYDDFLMHFIKTTTFNKAVLRSVEGGVRDYLFYENFSRIKLSLPCIEEQKKIAHLLTLLDDKIKNIQTQIEKTELYKKGLLQKMFC